MSNYSDSHFDESNKNTSWYKVYHSIPSNSKVLDVGCSSGNFGEVLINKKSCTVDGIELDKKDAKEASKKLRKVYVRNIETDSLKDIKKDYDIIYFGDVIEHLIDPVSALKKIQEHLKPNGRIVFSIPNMAHISVRLYLLRGDFEYTETGLLDKTHLHYYNLDEVQRVFAEANMELDKIDFVEKDYPRAVIKDYLAKMGLTASEKFYKRAQDPDAAAFQFVGSAKKASKKLKPRKLADFGPIDMFDTYHTNVVNGYEQRIKDLEKLDRIARPARKAKHQVTRVARGIKRRLK